MKVLVTGGLGFIGSHLVSALTARGDEVVVLDNATGAAQYHSGSALATFNESFEKFSSLTINPVSGFITEWDPRLVYHMGCQIDVRLSAEDPIGDLRVNGLGSANFFQQIYGLSSVERVIFSSSGGTVYGESPHAATEHKNTDPESPYGIGKLFAENTLKYFAKEADKGYVSLRYGNVFGPRQSPRGEAGVISIFAGLMLDGRDVTIFGDGSQTRDYVYVDDVIRANLLAGGIDSFDFKTQFPSGEYNICSGTPRTVLDVFEALKKITGYEKDPVFAPARKELRDSKMQNGKIKEHGWDPKVSFEQGLKDVVDWIKKERGVPLDVDEYITTEVCPKT